MATKNRWETLGIPTMYLHVLCITTKMWGSIEAFCRATCSNSEVIFPEWWTSSEAQSHKIHQNPSPFMIVDVAFSPLPSLENGKCTESEFWRRHNLGWITSLLPTFGWSATPTYFGQATFPASNSCRTPSSCWCFWPLPWHQWERHTGSRAVLFWVWAG